MAAEDAQCGLIYRAERTIRTRESGLMLNEERLVSLASPGPAIKVSLFS